MSSQSNLPFEATGGARVGAVNASWPFAKLTARSGTLKISVRLLGGDYHFTPDTVVSITRHTVIPILGWGVQIQHCHPEYPTRFIFWSFGNPDALLAGIRESGFIPRAPASSIPLRHGFALRWQAIVAAILAWNGFFFFDIFQQTKTFPSVGPFTLSAVGLAFMASIAAIRMASFQRLILKPDRRIEEIRPLLNLLILVTGFLFVGFAIMVLRR